MSTAATFRAPQRYVQGRNVLESAAPHIADVDADAALVAGGETALSVVESDLFSALEHAGIRTETESGVETCTDERVSALESRIERLDADVAIGVGGGTAIDAVKAAASRTGVAFVSVPTVASTDAPASSIAVLYDDEGRTAGIEVLDRPPELVLVDTDRLAAAPAAYLRYGLGDALSTRFEAAACAEANGRTLDGSRPTDLGRAIARRTHGTVVQHGAAAIDDADAGEPTQSFDRAVEAVLLQSAVGFENGGLAGAHAIETGFRLAGVTDPPHGLVVGFGTLAQLHLEDAPASDSVANLLGELGLSTTLSAFGVDGSTLDTIASHACSDVTTMKNEPVEVSPDAVKRALRSASADLE